MALPVRTLLALSFFLYSLILSWIFSLYLLFFSLYHLGTRGFPELRENKTERSLAEEKGCCRGWGQRGGTSRNSCSVSAPKARLLVPREKQKVSAYLDTIQAATYSDVIPLAMRSDVPCVLDGTVLHQEDRKSSLAAVTKVRTNEDSKPYRP